MNADEVKSNVTRLAIGGLGFLAGRYHLSGEQVAAIASDAGMAAAFLFGVYQHWGMKKVPELSRVVGPPMSILLAASFAMWGISFAGGTASAADLKFRNAAPLAQIATAAPLTPMGWQGFTVSADVGGSGTGVDVLNLGSVNANGQMMGGSVGYEVFNGTYLFGAHGSLAYDVTSPGDVVAASFSDKLFWRAGVTFGGPLANALGITVNFPGPLAMLNNGIPYISIDACGHHRATGYCVAGGMQFIVPNSRLTINPEYIHAQYGTTTTAPSQTINTENMIWLRGVYHFPQ